MATALRALNSIEDSSARSAATSWVSSRVYAGLDFPRAQLVVARTSESAYTGTGSPGGDA